MRPWTPTFLLLVPDTNVYRCTGREWVLVRLRPLENGTLQRVDLDAYGRTRGYRAGHTTTDGGVGRSPLFTGGRCGRVFDPPTRPTVTSDPSATKGNVVRALGAGSVFRVVFSSHNLTFTRGWTPGRLFVVGPTF